MPKRSLSSTDTESEIAASSQLGGILTKRQKTQEAPRPRSSFLPIIGGLTRSIMSIFRPSKSAAEAPTPHPTAKLYPQLPKPYSAPPSPPSSADNHDLRPKANGSIPEEGLSRQNPINLVDDDDGSSASLRSQSSIREANQAGPSRLASFQYEETASSRFTPASTSRPSKRSRPQLPKADGIKREYGWTGTSASSPSSSRSDLRKSTANHSRNVKSKSRPKVAATLAIMGTAISQTLTAKRRQEAEFRAAGDTQGPDSRARLQQLLSGAAKPTFDANIKQQPKLYLPSLDQPRKVQKRIEQSNDETISNLLEKIAFDKAEGDKLVSDRLEVTIPSDLLDEEEDLVDASLTNAAFSKGSVKIGSLQRLRPGIWLDDEIINHYGTMLQKRSKDDESGELLKVFYCNSFFYPKMQKGYDKSMSRWTKKVKIFDMDVLVMAINIRNQHWTCAAIDMRHKRVQYHDSMGDGGQERKKLFKTVMGYLAAEHQEKLGSPFDPTGWKLEFSSADPQQENGCDCGVFTCQTLENIARGKDLVADEWEFSQHNMPFFRRMMVYEIATEKLYKRW